MLNETSEGEHHVVLTQNALADGTYLDYVNFLYGDRLRTLNGDDSKRAFEDYMTDARKRLQHDQEFPMNRNKSVPAKTSAPLRQGAGLRPGRGHVDQRKASPGLAAEKPRCLLRSPGIVPLEIHLCRRLAAWPDDGTARAGRTECLHR